MVCARVHDSDICTACVERASLTYGSLADKHLCASVRFTIDPMGSGEYHVFDCNSEEIIRVLRIVFSELLDMFTLMRVAELYVPECLGQLSYVKRLNRIPGSVKSAIESRDIWFAEERGHLWSLVYKPLFEYLGNLAHGLRSSIKGALTKCNARPIAQAPGGPQGSNHFDL